MDKVFLGQAGVIDDRVFATIGTRTQIALLGLSYRFGRAGR
jgi:hypothetical protein